MWEGNASLATRENIGRTVVRSLLKAIKILHICREDPERRDLPVVHENRQMVIEVVRILFGILTDRQFQQKWNRFLEYLELLCDIGEEDEYHAEFLLNELPEEG